MSKDKESPASENYKHLIFNILSQKDSKEIEAEEKDETTKAIDEASKKWKINEKIVELFSNNIEKDQNLKVKCAIILIIILAIELVALIVIFILNGCGVLKYSNTTFNLFITGGIAEVFLLVRVIVKYLFKDNLTDALNIILKNNNPIKYEKNKNNRNKPDKT